MSTRRPASTTSLSRYARPDSPDESDRALDFCNSFWGLGDGGVDVLFARMRGAVRTAEEMRAFWKERALIEEDYAKRLAKLAKTVLGRDEIGELRHSFDTVRLETDRQANSHMELSQQMKRDLEQPIADFLAKQAAFKKSVQGPVEKLYKTKQTQENHVNRTREKYESDCIKINAFTGQSALVQGRELDKLHLKLEKLQETVKINEREFSNFVRALSDTTRKWDGEWKTFCDQCQDLEDERIEFMKDNMWNYANSISTVCVSDDESCEKIRIALESIDIEREIEYFVRHYGTGNDIPNPPQVISYQGHDGTPYRQTTRPADFVRNSSRPMPVRSAPPPPPQQVEEEVGPGNAGVGAGGRRGRAESISAGDGRASRATSRARRDSMASQAAVSMNGHGPPPSQTPQPSTIGRSSTAPTPAPHVAPMQPPSHAGSVPLPGMANPAAFRQAKPQQAQQGMPPQGIPGQERTQLKIGQNAYDVDPNADPQNVGHMGARSAHSISRPPTSVGDAADPLAQQLENLRNGGPARNPTRRGTTETPGPPYSPTHSRQGHPGATPSRAGSALQAPPGAFTAAEHAKAQNQALNRDYQTSADRIVGAHPSSRPVSPAAASPTAEFMRPRGQSFVGGQTPGPVEDIHSRYGQALPNERRLSRAGSHMTPPAGQPPARSPSPAREGYAGIGARSTSPQPPPQQNRMSTPNVPPQHYSQQQQQPPQQQPPQSVHRNSGIFPPQQQQPTGRATSPSPYGIALDASGQVTQDSMAEAYRQAYNQGQAPTPHQQMAPQQPQMPTQQQMHQQQHQYYGQQSGYGAPTPAPGHPQAGAYGGAASPAPPASYGQPPPQQQQQQQQPQQHGMPQQQHSMYQQYPNGQSQQSPYSPAPPGGGYYPGQQQQQQAQYGQPAYGQPPQQQHQPGSNAPPQQQQPVMTRTPSPLPPQGNVQQGGPPTGQYLDDGSGVLFYVKAMYNYTATIEEEFDFQEGDIIAVTSTPEDGWWHGVLLDDTRRVPGRTVFPSNFVTLF
ncbi:Cell division control protein 15 OS=Schizosaccharomyces pombe (strain 972 / ATCC 24843) GN=cdc15 PE=1 SV=2 [Rhizoctonia solani AG-1 IB]|uniref:Cell division control protein 15 n=1 Tax=Thanatephorus cucumeris (strain AG1-IB / isolate 7/3/14) TaxID=1108050 RepID=A0A0B7F8Y7_THACB|nr:Cell division control protein 15 OS=Schizosaccharomyces pombe (strain 972 / ATCC 24843) GN=cdc15 PE=1 SV=2 [Rhizoctonia solani AG-1 IB]